ncbi:MAG: sugar ABC transporter substrate-binding protein, partial [Myxococcota bacterium]
GVNIDSEAARNAINAFAALNEEGLIDVKVPDESVRNHWFTGNAAIIIDGTWRVDANDAALANDNVVIENYYFSEHPQLFEQGGAWADTHMWAIPAPVKEADSERFMAALKLLAHINAHNEDWARTGHLPVRTSVLESEELKAMPHRSEYAETAAIGYYMAPAKKYGAIQDAIGRNLVEFYQNDRPLDDVLADMQLDVEDEID